MSKPSRRARTSPARRAAYEALSRIEGRGAFAQDVIAKVIDASALPESERAFATRLVLGVVSMRGSLDAVLDRCMRTPGDAKTDVRRALRISAYEIVYLDKSPHAAVDQGVELVRSIAPRAAGLANAVLRKVVAAREAFPFGEADAELSAFALLQGFPAWLAELLARDLGDAPARALMAASNEPAPIFLYENPLKCAPGLVAQVLAEAGCATEEVDEVSGVPLSGCLRLCERRDLAGEPALGLIDAGLALVSDASAQAVAAICAILAVSGGAAGEGASGPVRAASQAPAAAGAPSVLELCAGRGTKTAMVQGNIRRLLGALPARYVALDNVPFKCELLAERARTLGARVDEVVCADLAQGEGPIAGGGFDVVLLDAPCSGLGTLRRHPEIRWRVTPEIIASDAARDAALLRRASQSVSPGGYLVYATCTVTRAEDEDAVEGFLASEAGSSFERVPLFGSCSFAPALGPGGPDAHFCAVMCRAR